MHIILSCVDGFSFVITNCNDSLVMCVHLTLIKHEILIGTAFFIIEHSIDSPSNFFVIILSFFTIKYYIIKYFTIDCLISNKVFNHFICDNETK